MPTLKDTTTGETFRVQICYICDTDKYSTGKPILHTDEFARQEKDGSWTWGECVIEESNKRRLRILGRNHPEVKAFIQKEDNDCKRWNNYTKRVNQNIDADLKYQKNKYSGRVLFSNLVNHSHYSSI
jgi:hypothetical protein